MTPLRCAVILAGILVIAAGNGPGQPPFGRPGEPSKQLVEFGHQLVAALTGEKPAELPGWADKDLKLIAAYAEPNSDLWKDAAEMRLRGIEPDW